MAEEGRRQDSRGLHDGQQTDTTVRRTRRDGTALSRLPTWPSCSNASGLNEALAVERSAEGIKAVPYGIFRDDLSLQLVCHCEWRALNAKRKRRGASCGAMSKLCQACGNPTFASACQRAVNDSTLADVAISRARTGREQDCVNALTRLQLATPASAQPTTARPRPQE